MSPTNTTGTASVNVLTVNAILPIAAENQAVVQLRWVIRDVSGSGNRPTFSIDNISVTGTSAPTINGTIAAGEYGVHTNGSNQETNAITWYNTWDATNLYFGIGATNNNSNESAVIYIDMNPITPVNGGSNTNGTNFGFSAYDRATYNPSFRADFVLYFKNGYYEYRTANGSGGWNTQVVTGLTYAQSGAGAGQSQEISIPWSAITGGAMPASFNWHAFKIYDNNASNNGIYGQVPTNNPGGAQNVAAYTLSANRYYTVSSTTIGSSTLPFSRLSYCQPIGTTSNGFGTASFWDFTVNPGTGFQVARSNAGGDWTISGNLVVGSGILYFGSGGSGYGQSTIANVNVTGGTFDMDQTNKTMNVSGGITIGSGGTFKLSGTVGGDVSLAGNWSNSGTFTPSTRLVTFNGTTAQTLTGATTFDFLTLNNTTGLTLNNSVVVNQTLGLTSGKITLGANDLTVGSAGTITGASATNYIVTNGLGQLKRTVVASNTLFAVGNAAYNPITLNNSGTSDVYGIIAVDGTFATPNDNTRIVNRRWQVTEGVAGGSTLAIQAQYNSGELAANFAAATTPYIGYYNGSVWSQVGATLSGANPFVATSSANSTPSNLTSGTNYFAIGKDAAFIPLPATQFVITSIAPVTPQAGSGFNVTVQAQNALNLSANVTANTSFTLTTNGNAGAISGTVTGTIVAGTNSIVVSGVILATTGTGATITATQTSGDPLTAGTSAAFNVVAGADHLTFVGVPATGNVSTNLTSFTVEARRPDNSVDTGYTANVTIAKATGPGNLTGTVTVAAVAGVATFNAAQFDAIGTYTLTATSGVLAPDTSGNIVITLVPSIIAQFDFTPFTLPTATQVTLNDVNVSVTDFAISSGTLSVGQTTGTNFPNEPFVAGTGGYTSTTQAGAKNFNFAINANTGYKIEVTSLEFNALATSAGPSAFSFDIASGTSIFTTNAPDTALVPVNQTVIGVNNLTSIPVLIQGWLNGSRTSSGAGNFRIDDVIVRGYVTCIEPIAYAITGGGNGCATTGVAVGLANSQVGISYQLKIGGTNTGLPVAGTGSAISFGNQLTSGTYTVEASNIVCSLNLTMTGNAVVTINPSPTLDTVTATPACENTPSSVTITGLLPSTVGSITYTNSFTGPVVYTESATSDALGNFTFNTPNLPLIANGAVITITSAIVTASGCTTNFTGKTVIVVVNPNLPASVTIAASPSNAICAGTSVIFTATPTNGGTTPGYQWRINGSPVSGEINATFTTSTLANNDVVTVVMTSNATCATGSPATSAGISMSVSTTIDYANLQFPGSSTICQGASLTAYGQVFEPGVTPGTGLQGAGITVEFGYDTANTNPNTWTNWFAATFNSLGGGANNDEYQYTFTPASSGTYYYAFRYKQGACDWQYGGYNGSGGGFWNGTTNNSGVLTVNPIPTLNTITATPACEGTPSSVTMTGLLPSTVGSFFYTNSFTGPIQYPVSGTSDASGNFSFTTPNLPLAANGAIITIVSGAVTATGCTTTFTGKTVTVTVSPTSVGGSVSGGTTICSGSTSGLLTLSGHTGSIVRWESSVSPFTTWSPIVNTAATYTSGIITQTTQFRAVVQSGVCPEAFSNPTTVSVITTTWDGTAWDNGTPDSTKSAVISNNLTINSNFAACSLVVNNNAVVVVNSGFNVILEGQISVATGSSFTLNNNANLLQNSDVANTGNIKVKRQSSLLMRQDYTLWSSPVANQNLLAFSPNTLTNRFYTYNPTTNLYNTVTSPSTTSFAIGKGYLIRIPNNFPTTPTNWPGTFTGVPNNGPQSFALTNVGPGQRFNAVGNPYPSPIDMQQFVDDNQSEITGTLYFWRKTNSTTTSPGYCTWTAGTFVTNNEAQVFDPNDVIRTGQGFIVEATATGTTVNFNNGQRIADNANQFFRSANRNTLIERNRYWLNITDSNQGFAQMAVGYITDATQGIDKFDGKYLADGTLSLNSIINNTDYVIQGKALPFNENDIVPLNFKTQNAGTFTIALDHVDGFFSNDQRIFLKDKTTNNYYDLKAANYTFTSDAGTFNNRFEIVYKNAYATNLQSSQCGTLLSAINSNIYANLVSGAQAYRFKVTDVTTLEVQTIDRALRVFALTQLSNFKYDSTYRIEVAVKKNNVWQPYGNACTVTTPIVTTKVQSSQCGITLNSLEDIIYADLVSYTSGYRFEVTNTENGSVEILDRPLREFRVNLLANPLYNATYSVRVAVKNTDGTYLPYGQTCEINTPRTVVQTITKGIENKVTFKAVAYPNPYENSFNLDLITPSESIIELKVYDMIGKLIESRKVEYNELNTIQLGEKLPSGIYNVVINQGDQSQNIRVIKR